METFPTWQRDLSPFIARTCTIPLLRRPPQHDIRLKLAIRHIVGDWLKQNTIRNPAVPYIAGQNMQSVAK